MSDERNELPPAPGDGVDRVRGAITGVFALVWIGGAAVLCAGAVAAGTVGLGALASIAMTALGGVGAAVGFAVLMSAMARPRVVAARRLLAVLGFAFVAGVGTVLSPIPGSWGVLSVLGAAACAAALAGAAFLSASEA